MEEDDFGFSICIVFPFQPCRQTLLLHKDGRTDDCGGNAEKFGQKGKTRRGGDQKIMSIISTAYSPP